MDNGDNRREMPERECAEAEESGSAVAGTRTAQYITIGVKYILPDFSETERSEGILSERTISVYIDGELAFHIVCTMQYLRELIVGRLRTEDIIRDKSDIDSIMYDTEGEIVQVQLKKRRIPHRAAAGMPGDLECPGGGPVLEKLRLGSIITQLPALHYEKSWIFALATRMAGEMELYNATHNAHSCFLMSEGSIIFECEDIGRHNAIDKAVGWLMLNGIDPGKCIILTSGRVPLDMTRKVIRAGIPVFCSNAKPSLEALALARRYGLTLLGHVRTDGYAEFNIPE